MRRPEIRMIRHGSVLGVESLRWRVEQSEAFRGHAGDHLGGHAAPRPGFANAKQPSGARHARHHRVGVERLDRAQVHDLNLDAFAGEFLRHGQRFVDHGAVGHDGHVAADAGDARFARGQRLGRQLLRLEMVIEKLVLAENHRVIDGDRVEQHAVGILDRGGRHHHQAGVMRVNRLKTLTVERSAARRAAERETDDNGTRHLRAPEQGRGLIHDLVEAHCGEVGELHLDDRPHPFDGGTDGRADHGVFADRCVEHAARIFLREILGRLEGAAELPDILAVDIDARIFGERAGLRFANGFEIGDAHAGENENEAGRSRLVVSLVEMLRG